MIDETAFNILKSIAEDLADDTYQEWEKSQNDKILWTAHLHWGNFYRLLEYVEEGNITALEMVRDNWKRPRDSAACADD